MNLVQFVERRPDDDKDDFVWINPEHVSAIYRSRENEKLINIDLNSASLCAVYGTLTDVAMLLMRAGTTENRVEVKIRPLPDDLTKS